MIVEDFDRDELETMRHLRRLVLLATVLQAVRSVVTQLSPTIRVFTPLGEGDAHFLLDDGPVVYWQVFIRRTGESWFFRNHFIRLADDISAEIGPSSPIDLPRGIEKHIARYRKNGWLK